MMKFEFEVSDLREAGYAEAMLAALRAAMEKNPPAQVSPLQWAPGWASPPVSVPSVWQSQPNDAAYPASNTQAEKEMAWAGLPPYEKDAIRSAVAEGPVEAVKTSETAPDVAVVHDEHGPAAPATEQAPKRRGRPRKTADASAPGKAFEGATAADLQAALEALPLIHSDGGVEVRSASTMTSGEIQALSDAEEQQAAIEQDKEKAAAAEAIKVEQEPAKEAIAEVEGFPGLDPDLARLLREQSEPKKEEAPAVAASPYDTMDRASLVKAFVAYANGEGGLLWLRKVIEDNGKQTIDQLTDDELRAIMKAPSKYSVAA